MDFSGYQEAERQIAEAKLTGATSLDLSGMELYELPKALWQLTDLRELNIADNGIGDAGARTLAVHLTKLTSLDIGNNRIGVLGAQVLAENLTVLTTLNICDNRIGNVGARTLAEHLTGLASLNISINGIGDAGARALAEHLTNLTSLGIAYNQIGEAGARALAEHLFNLTSLGIHNNEIGDAGVRALAEHLTKLTTLDIEGCAIENAAVIVGLIERLRSGGQSGGCLDRICVRNNPLKTPAGDKIETSGLSGALQPVGDVLEFLKRAMGEDAFVLREARMVLIGVGENGKSQLARALSGSLQKDEKVNPNDRTKGIDVETIQLPTQKHGEVITRLFDCGGQPEQYQIHRALWTAHRNALVLVVDATKPMGFAGNRVDYFLRMIESEFANGSADGDGKPGRCPPVLIVLTKADRMGEVAGQAGYPTLRALEEMTRGRGLDVKVFPYAIDGVRQTHFQELRQALSDLLDRTEGVSTTLPRHFGKVREAVQQKLGTWSAPNSAIHELTLTDYRKVCKEAGETSIGQQDIYLRTMAAVGDVIWLSRDGLLCDTALNIHWARKALYLILTDKKIKDAQGGVMKESDLVGLTQKESAKGKALLETVAERLGVTYPIDMPPDPNTGQVERAWLVPDLLKTADNPHWSSGEAEYRVEFGGFLSEAVFLRFIAGARKYIRNIRDDARRDLLILTRSDWTQVLVRPEYDRKPQAIALWAYPNNPASVAWCEALSWGFGGAKRMRAGVACEDGNEIPVRTRRSGNTYNIGELHLHGGRASFGDVKEFEDMIDNSVKIKGNVTHAQVGQTLTNCTNLVQQAPAERKQSLEELDAMFRELTAKLPEEKRAGVLKKYEALLKEATSQEPERDWYSLSAKGLLEAAKWTKDFTKNIGGALLNIGKTLFGGDYELPKLPQ